MMSESCVQEEEGEACGEPESGNNDQQRLYVFPSVSNNEVQRGPGVMETTAPLVATRVLNSSNNRGHARYASDGGVVSSGPGLKMTTGNAATSGGGGGALLPTGRASALKKPGHKRAFSQGQLTDMQQQQQQQHTRVGSKTDFILPSSHREDPPRLLTDKIPSFRGHSRQASR